MRSSIRSADRPTRDDRTHAWRVRVIGLGLIFVMSTSMLACGKSPEPQSVKLPPVTNLREAANSLVTEADQIDGPPPWLNREHQTDGYIYGVGTEQAKRDAAQDLFTAMRNGRNIVIAWISDNGLDPRSPLGLVEDLPEDRDRIQFEEIAYDQLGHKWYALARLSKDDEARLAKIEIDTLNDGLDQSKATLLDAHTSNGDRVRSGLRILHQLDRRSQWNARYTFFAGESLSAPSSLDDHGLKQLARAVLSEHQVRILVDGAHVPGLYEAIESALGRVYITVSEFGTGLITVTFNESSTQSAGMDLLVLDGIVQMTIEGEEGLAISRPIRAVTTDDGREGARARNARTIDEEIAAIVGAALRDLAR